MTRPVALTLLPLLAACAKERPLAPTEMTDLVRYMFQSWEDEELLAEGVANLGPWLDANVPSEEAEDGYRLDPLTEEDVSTVDHPDRPLDQLIGAAGGATSAFPVVDHAAYIVLPDQTFSNPSQYKVYVREVSGDQDAFVGGEGMVRTTNQIETSSFGVTIPYELKKDYRWIRTEEEEVVVGRAWIEERGCNDGGGNCVEQTFSIDLFGARGDESVRFTASWSEVSSSIALGDDVLTAGLALGIQNVFESSEAYLAGTQ